MQDIQELWDNVDKMESSMTVDVSMSKRPSHFELNVFKRTLKIEIGASLSILLALLLFSQRLPNEILAITVFTSLVGLLFSIYGFMMVQRIDLAQSSSAFMHETIRFLRSFSTQLILLTLTLLVLMSIFLNHSMGDGFEWSWFVTDSTGLLLLWLSPVIMLSVILYVKAIYGKRISNLRGVLEELE